MILQQVQQVSLEKLLYFFRISHELLLFTQDIQVKSN